MRTTEQKLALYRRFFTGRMDVRGTYDVITHIGKTKKEPVTDQVFLAHLLGKEPYGVHLLQVDRTRAIVADFDADELDGPRQFVTVAQGYGLAAYVERSKRKGYHAWLWFEVDGVLAVKARVVVQHILGKIGLPRTEVFPKQDRLDANCPVGNFINAPFWGPLVPQGRTVFLLPPDFTQVAPCQWDVLEQIRPVKDIDLDEVIAENELLPVRRGSPTTPATAPEEAMTPGAQTFGLPPCAQRMLATGVTENQRVSCFRLAVGLKRAGVPQDLASVVLQGWAGKNKPRNGKSIIRIDEIVAQVSGAYGRPYRSCGCEDAAVKPYCDPKCLLHPSNRATSNDGMVDTKPGVRE
jgi:hypothetical protein